MTPTLPASVVEQYRGFTKDPLEFPIGARFRYSGLGYSILGHVLELVGGSSYESLLKTKLFDPLQMPDTVITLSLEQQKRVANHYTWDNKVPKGSPIDPGPRWEFPTSAHYSTVPDLLRFLSFQLHRQTADRAPVAAGTINEMHIPQRLQNNWNDAIGVGWWIEPNSEIGDIVWHKGGSSGFGSYVALSSRYDLGVIVFTNRNKSVEEIGRWFLIELAKVCGVDAPPSRADADGFWRWRDWSNAAWAYGFLVKQNAKDSEAWYRLASACHRMRDLKQAIPAYKKAISLGKTDEGYAQYSLARCYASGGQRADAVAELRRAVKAGFRDADDELTTEPDFDVLRADSGFNNIIAAVRKRR
jgi:CubicO group peptidase (beta-lactamase class C family)